MHARKPAFQPTPNTLASATLYALSLMAVTGMTTGQAIADEETNPLRVQKIEVTGSSIKRLDAEKALPVQRINREAIEKAGVTTASELLGMISANAAALSDGQSFSDISGQRGFNGANLRGIGVSSTLVLLNGRRLANFASPGGNAGVDLNAIPASAITRVEVLKDGASAIYGTDAVGGVINFITKDNYQGAEINAYFGDSQHGGAGKQIVTLSGGVGDLESDRYNLMAVLDYQKTKPLRSTQRDWIGSAYQPDINLDVGSSNTFPANVRRTKSNGSATGPRLNPSAPKCNPPATIYAADSFVGSSACLYDYMHDTEIFPESDRLSLITRGQMALSSDTTLFAEALQNDTRTTYRISPLTISNLNYPLGGPFYPTQLITSNQTPLRVNMRLSEAGPRTNKVDALAQRLLLGIKSHLGEWDVDAAVNHSTNTVDDNYIDGYVKTSAFDSAFKAGKINPFGPSGIEGKALLEAAKINDAARHAKGNSNTIEIKGSRDLFELAGGTAGVALGAEYRKEEMAFTPSALLEQGEIRGDGAATAFSGDRKVSALYAELNLPLLKTLEIQTALRRDHYSDFGSTLNPKLGVRWTPLPELMVRSSYGTGFRAPSLADLYTPPRIGQTNGIYNDPLGCIKTATLDNTDNPDYCGLQPDKLTGGRDGLQPEESKQFSFGIVLEPGKGFSTTLDYWRIKKSNVIVAPEGSLFDDPVRNAAYITRDTPDPALPGIPGRILSVDSRLRNIGSLKTSGIDLGADWKLPATDVGRFAVSLNGTYVIDYVSQEADGGPEINGVGVFANDQVVQRWRHSLAFNFDRGPLGLTMQQTYYHGYKDQNPMPDGSPRRLEAYQLWDLSGSYRVSRALRLRVGVKNLFDQNPPRSNQVYHFIAGYDPSYTDPRGRYVYGSVSYAFK
ncbi:TonB-dependent receptor [Burkholderiaceae bacterium DAT-1]|nr:TonB-dependent receptor [Burkholderiaceae bacterium DAT-1]